MSGTMIQENTGDRHITTIKNINHQHKKKGDVTRAPPKAEKEIGRHNFRPPVTRPPTYARNHSPPTATMSRARGDGWTHVIHVGRSDDHRITNNNRDAAEATQMF